MRYIIFGAGRNTKSLIPVLESQQCSIVCIVDNDESKWGTHLGNYEIKQPSALADLVDKETRILVTVSNRRMYWEILRQLMDMGFLAGRDFEDAAAMMSLGDVPGRVSGEIILPQGFKASKSFDPASRLVFLTGEKRLFRMVTKGYETAYRNVLKKCQASHLFGNYIIDTEEVVNQWDLPCALLLEHQYVAPITYSFEWTPRMYQDYVGFMLDLIENLTEASLALVDGHHLNATISEGRFVFLDFGAIGEGITSDDVLFEFLNMHLIPLILMKRHQIAKAYACLKNSGVQYTLMDVLGYLSEDEATLYRGLIAQAIHVENVDDMRIFVNHCRQFIQQIGDYEMTTDWNGYQDDEWSKSESPLDWSVKMRNVIGWLKELQPQTLLDVAGNMGWYGSYLHKQMKYAIIMDMDSNCLDVVWHRSSQESYRNVYPVYMSFCTPTLAIYRDVFIDQSLGVHSWIPSAKERLSSEVVLALAIVHHLAFRWQMTFEEIIGQLRAFSTKYLIVEFVEKSDRYIKDFQTAHFDWYTKENFEIALRKKFNVLSTALSVPADTRTLYLCEIV